MKIPDHQLQFLRDRARPATSGPMRALREELSHPLEQRFEMTSKWLEKSLPPLGADEFLTNYAKTLSARLHPLVGDGLAPLHPDLVEGTASDLATTERARTDLSAYEDFRDALSDPEAAQGFAREAIPQARDFVAEMTLETWTLALGLQLSLEQTSELQPLFDSIQAETAAMYVRVEETLLNDPGRMDVETLLAAMSGDAMRMAARARLIANVKDDGLLPVDPAPTPVQLQALQEVLAMPMGEAYPAVSRWLAKEGPPLAAEEYLCGALELLEVQAEAASGGLLHATAGSAETLRAQREELRSLLLDPAAFSEFEKDFSDEENAMTMVDDLCGQVRRALESMTLEKLEDEHGFRFTPDQKAELQPAFTETLRQTTQLFDAVAESLGDPDRMDAQTLNVALMRDLKGSAEQTLRIARLTEAPGNVGS